MATPIPDEMLNEWGGGGMGTPALGKVGFAVFLVA